MPRPHQSKAVIHLENLCNIMGGEGGVGLMDQSIYKRFLNE